MTAFHTQENEEEILKQIRNDSMNTWTPTAQQARKHIGQQMIPRKAESFIRPASRPSITESLV